MNTPLHHNDEFSTPEQHLLMGALYGELSEEEGTAWEHLKQQKPALADEYTRLKQTTEFLPKSEQRSEHIDEHQSDTPFFDRQWQTLEAMMQAEQQKTVAPVLISLPSNQPIQAKRLFLFTLPQMQRWYGIAAMLIVAVGLGISVVRWQTTVSHEGSITTERREQDATMQDATMQDVQEQGVKPSPASPSESEQEQAFGTAAKPSPSLSRPNTPKGASEQATPKNSTEQPVKQPVNADVPAQQPRDAAKSETAQQEEFKKDAEETAKERPAERKQATPASEVAQPAPIQPTQKKIEQPKSEQPKSEQSADEARSTTPAPQASPILDVLKSLAVPQGGSGSSSGARQRLENNLQQTAPKRAAPALPNSQATPHRTVTSTQPTLRVGADSTKVRLKMQDSTRK